MKCSWCDLEMLDEKTITCPENKEVKYPDGTKLPSVPYDRGEPGRCHDCKVDNGQKHHPGCDMERCPKCKGQLIGCGCLNEEEGGS